MEDDFGMILEEYGEAKVAVTVIPVAASTYASDTTGYVDIAQGNTYQFKITSLDGNVPNFGIGNSNAIALVSQSQEGNNYFFKVQAIGQVGDEVGIYINRDANKVATLRITEGDATAAYTCDTTAVNVAAGASYQVEITAAAQPTLAAGNPATRLSSCSAAVTTTTSALPLRRLRPAIRLASTSTAVPARSSRLPSNQ